jgi:hypothetical protein
MAILIRDWFITARNDDPYSAPETGATCLAGKIDWHPELKISPEMCEVTTSAIVGEEGRLVRTYSGREYQLVGEPSPYFHDFLQRKGMEFDDNNPLHEINVKGYLHG